MAVFTTPFTAPGNYTYDSNKIEVSGGVALIKENLVNVYARYHMNESSGIAVPDSSGNVRDGVAVNMEDADWVSAKLNNGLAFDGVNKSVNLGNIANFEYNQPFSLEIWFLASGGGTYTFISKMQTVGPSRGWLFYIQTGLIKFTLRNATPAKEAWVQTINTFNDGVFHHAILTYNGSGITSGIKLYVDNVSETLTINSDTLGSSTILNTGNCSIGSRNSVNLFYLDTLDEAVIYDKVLSVPEVNYRWNSGIGREKTIRYSDKPTIYKTAGDSGTIFAFNNFSVTDGVIEGSKGYQLSEDGITWKYWDAPAWSVAGALDYNTAAVVNTNINTFSAVSNAIWAKTFLISDGLQREEVDEIQITYTENSNPTVDAGSNKEVFDNLFATPFSDANFFDEDGSVDHAYYKIDGEVPSWTEILQGGYASLLESVQAFSYQFTNTGEVTVRLQAEDNLGGTNEDSMIMTVKQYLKIVNVKDVVTDDHILNFDFNPGDSSGTAQQDSPFNWSWDYGSFDITVEKDFFYVKQQSIMVTNEDELTIFLQASAFLNECRASIGLKTEGDELAIMAWLQQGGELITNPTSCLVELYDESDVKKYTSSTLVHDGGHFRFNESPSGLENEGVYHLEITIVAGGVSFTSVVSVGLMERKLISFENAIHINVDTGTTGTLFPKGTPQFPVDNWADAKIIADANSFKTISVTGDLVISSSESIAGYTVQGSSAHVATISTDGGSTESTTFIDIEVSGVLNGFIHMHHCHMQTITGLRGHIHSSLIRGPLTLGGGQEAVFSNCYSGIPGLQTPIVDAGGSGQELQMRGHIGGVTIINKTGSDRASIDVLSGQVIIDSTCVNGTIVVRGIVDNFVDNSGLNCTVTRPLLQDLKDVSLGKWVIDPAAKTLTLYRIDGESLKVFNLGDTDITMPSFITRIPQS